MRSTCVWLSVLLATSAGATTYPVGAARTYKSPCLLVATVTLGPGDVVEVDPGTYTDFCQLKASGSASSPIVLRGIPGPRPVFDAMGKDLSGSGSVPRAIFQFTGGSHWLVQHLEFKNAANSSNNGAAFRATAGAFDIVIEDVSVHDCHDGMMSDGPATVTVRNSDIFANGANDGQSHNFYLQGQTTALIGNHIHDSRGGQNVKIRSHDAVLLYNLIDNGGNYEIDLIQGPLTDAPNANAVLIGNVIIRPPTSGNNSQVILFGTDNPTQTARNGSLYAVNNTIILQNASNRLFHAINPVSGSAIHFDNNIVVATVGGTALTADGTTAGIFSGNDNWIGSNVGVSGALVGTLTGVDPGFVGPADHHLRADSPVVGRALVAPTFVDDAGVTGPSVPLEEFAPPLGTQPRPRDGALDIGAYEYASPDAGSGNGPPDAGSGNGSPDAGLGGGPPDGGSGSGADPLVREVLGSGCTAAVGTPFALLALLVGVLVVRRPRRPLP